MFNKIIRLGITINSHKKLKVIRIINLRNPFDAIHVIYLFIKVLLLTWHEFFKKNLRNFEYTKYSPS